MGGLSADGTDRGIILQVIVVLAALWFFTVPPEFRRTKICPPTSNPDEFVATTTGLRPRDCITSEEFQQNVQDYYRNGGGIQWDFSIDPGTVAKNQATWDSLFGEIK
jgi:hypothetical protein